MRRRQPTTDYRVWAPCPSEQHSQYAVAAEFRYFQDALDYLDYAERRGVHAVLTGPPNYRKEVNA
jgi:hypothetical protein